MPPPPPSAPYTPAQPAGQTPPGTTPGTGTASAPTVTYGHYPAPAGAYAAAPSAYATTYQTPYASGVSSYGSWHYPYGYVAPQTQSYGHRPAVPVAATTAQTPSQVGPQRTTFSAYPASYTPYRKDTVPAAGSAIASTAGRASRKQSSFKGMFSKELRSLMFGFGDDRNPATDTVNVLEEVLVEYICDVCLAASGPSRKSRISIEDLRRVLSRPPDAKKLARMEELLFMQEDIKRARAQFEDLNPKSYQT